MRSRFKGGVSASAYACRFLDIADSGLPEGLGKKLGQSEKVLRGARESLGLVASRPLVSVILFNRNGQKALTDTMASVIGQDYLNFELIMVGDDGSDTLMEIAASNPDGRVRIIDTGTLSEAAARNAGLSDARGEYLAHISCGTVWHPSTLSQRMLAIHETPALLSCCSGGVVHYQGRHGELVITAPQPDRTAPDLLTALPGIALDRLQYHRSLHDVLGGFDENVDEGAAHAMILRYVNASEPLELAGIPVISQDDTISGGSVASPNANGFRTPLSADTVSGMVHVLPELHASISASRNAMRVAEPENSAKTSLPAEINQLSPHDGKLGEFPEDRHILLVESGRVGELSMKPRGGCGIILPVFDGKIDRAVETARILLRRAGAKASVVIVDCQPGESYVPVVNAVVQRLDARHVVYTGNNVFAGQDWLKTGLQALKTADGGLLAFNDGRLAPDLAVSGLVQLEWVRTVNDGMIFHPGYLGHGADADLTAAAKLANKFVFDPDAVLMTLDGRTAMRTGYSDKVQRKQERSLLAARFAPGVADRPPEPEPPTRWRARVSIVPVEDLSDWSLEDPSGVVVIMPALDEAEALRAAKTMISRAGSRLRVLIALDKQRGGFINAVNAAARQIRAKYLVYSAQDARPGVDWLKRALRCMENSPHGLLAFNDGKWRGRLAGFGMVRTSWVEHLYGGAVFHDGYRSHRADNELTVIARAQRRFVYCPSSILLEQDASKALRRTERSADNFTAADRALFEKRYREGFDGLAPLAELDQLWPEYFAHHRKAS